MLRHSPGFTLGAITILALGVGVNLTEFQVFDELVFHRLTIRDASEALQFSRVTKQGRRLGFPPAAVEFYRAQSSSFAWLVAEDTSIIMTIDSGTVRSGLVSPDYFPSLGVIPAFGRLLDSRDSDSGAPLVAVLGHDYWVSEMGADPRAVGRVIRINNQPVEIVGVLSSDFGGLGIASRSTAVWLPVAARARLVAGSAAPSEDFSRASQALYGKVKSGVSLAGANAELTRLTRELSRRQPLYFQPEDLIRGEGVEASLSHAFLTEPAIFIFMFMILLVLISACANLGNMLLARGLARQREISIRTAIGAGRARIIRQLMTENLLLAILGAAAGVAVGWISGRLLLYLLGAPGLQLPLRWPVFAAGFALALFSAVAFGLPSALQTVNAHRARTRLRQSLIGVQVAVSCLLLISCGVLAHDGILLNHVDIAFDYQNMIVVDPQLYVSNLPPAAMRQKLDALSTRLARLPGVDRVTAAVARRSPARSPTAFPAYRESIAMQLRRPFSLP